MINVTAYGAVGDCGYCENGGSISSGSPNLTVTTGIFVSGDVGKTVFVAGAGASGGPLYTTVASFTDSRHVALSANASTTASFRTIVIYRTDDTAAFTSAIRAANPLRGDQIYVPSGVYQCSPVISAATNRLYITLTGDGPSSVLVPPQFKTGVSVIANIQTNIQDIKVVGGQCGIYLHSNNHGKLRNVTIIDQALQGQSTPPPWDGDSIFVNGDDSTEIFIEDIMSFSCMGSAYHYWRSSTTDNGGMYLSKFSSEGSVAGRHGLYAQGPGGGSGYTNGTGYTLGIVANPYDVNAGGATGTFDVVGGSVTNVRLSGGSNYNLAPYLIFMGAGTPTIPATARILPTGGGFGTNSQATIATSDAVIVHSCTDITCDGYNGAAVAMNDVTNVRMTNLFASGSNPGGGQVWLNNCVQMTFSNIWAQNGYTADTTSAHVRIENASHDLGFSNINLPLSAAFGFYMDSTVAANYNNQLVMPVSDMYLRTTPIYPSNGLICNDFNQLTLIS